MKSFKPCNEEKFYEVKKLHSKLRKGEAKKMRDCDHVPSRG